MAEGGKGPEAAIVVGLKNDAKQFLPDAAKIESMYAG